VRLLARPHPAGEGLDRIDDRLEAEGVELERGIGHPLDLAGARTARPNTARPPVEPMSPWPMASTVAREEPPDGDERQLVEQEAQPEAQVGRMVLRLPASTCRGAVSSTPAAICAPGRLKPALAASRNWGLALTTRIAASLTCTSGHTDAEEPRL